VCYKKLVINEGGYAIYSLEGEAHEVWRWYGMVCCRFWS